MARNLSAENEWLKKNYKRIEIRVKKDIGEQFINLLKTQGISVNSWGNEQIEKYLKQSNKKTAH